MKRYSLLLLVAAAFASPAHAQDTGSGVRIELVGMIDNINAEGLGEDNSNIFNPNVDRDVDGAFGASVGFDFVRGPGIGVGVDVEYTRSTSRQNAFINNAVVGEVKFTDDIYAGGRVTAPVSGSFSIVAKLGYTRLNAEFEPTVATFTLPAGSEVPTDHLSGIRAGIGLHFTGDDDDNVYYGGEYRYSNYEQSVVRHQFGLVIGTRF